MAQDERPVDSTAKAICRGPARKSATFHGDDPELAARVLERVCNQITVIAAGDDGAATKQRSSPDDRDVSAEDARAADSLGPMMSVIAASDSVSLQA